MSQTRNADGHEHSRHCLRDPVADRRCAVTDTLPGQGLCDCLTDSLLSSMNLPSRLQSRVMERSPSKTCMRPLLITAVAVAAVAREQQPHLILIIGDDMGSNDVGYSDPFLDTPAMDGLASSGVKFSTMYTWDWCAPSRGSLLSGRYAPNHGYEAGGDGPAKGTVGGLPTEFELLPAVLSKLGYATSMVGKWHLGYGTRAHLPENRGFDSYLGYLTGAEDYYTHAKSPVAACPTLDFWNGTRDGGGGNSSSTAAGPADIDRRNATYSTDTFARRAVATIAAHPNASSAAHGGAVPPLFLYAAFQGVHGPLEVPESVYNRVVPPPNGSSSSPSSSSSSFDVGDEGGGWKETCSWANYVKAGSKGFKCDKSGDGGGGANCFCNRLVVKAQMLSLDDAIADIHEALKARGLYGDSVLVVMGDNGGPTFEAHSNSPLRGGKLNFFEGGIRPAAFLHSGSKKLLPDDGSSRRGGWYNGSLHETDVFATFVALANGTAVVNGSGAAAGTGTPPPTFNGFAIDGVNVWGALLDGAGTQPPPRTEVLLADYILRKGDWKLVAGADAEKCKNSTTAGVCVKGVLRDCMLGTGGGWLDPPTKDNHTNVLDNLCPMDVYTKNDKSHYGEDICCSEEDAPGCHPVTAAVDKLLCSHPCTMDHPCLYDLAMDPQERADVAAAHPDVVAKMVGRLAELQKNYYPPEKSQLPDNGQFCAWAARRGGFLGPFLDGPPP